jgi:hypothetical protein
MLLADTCWMWPADFVSLTFINPSAEVDPDTSVVHPSWPALVSGMSCTFPASRRRCVSCKQHSPQFSWVLLNA